MQPRAPPPPAPASLAAAVQLLAPLALSGSLVLALSDFAGLPEEPESDWLRLAAHAECRLYWITDALEERGLPDGRFRGGVPGRLRPFDGGEVRARWLAGWRRRADSVQRLADRLRTQPVRLDTKDVVEQVLPPLLRAPQFAA